MESPRLPVKQCQGTACADGQGGTTGRDKLAETQEGVLPVNMTPSLLEKAPPPKIYARFAHLRLRLMLQAPQGERSLGSEGVYCIKKNKTRCLTSSAAAAMVTIQSELVGLPDKLKWQNTNKQTNKYILNT